MIETIIAAIAVAIWVFSGLNFLWKVPHLLKRIADALEKESRNAD